MTPAQPATPWWRWALSGLSALGLALSGYLGWHYVMGGAVIGCDGGSPCDLVLGSAWSAIGGVLPVSGLAAGAYLAMLLTSFNLGPGTEAPVRKLAWRAMLVLSCAAAGSAVWFIVVQKWYLGAFCPYCMATHGISLMLAALVIWRATRAGDDPLVAATSSAAVATPLPQVFPAGESRAIGLRGAIGLSLVGLALAGTMAASQVIFAPQVVAQSGETPVFRQTKVDPHTVPIVGSPDAPYVFTLLFDYECPHCQRLHEMLEEVIRLSGGKVAFTLCPTPLNPHCNRYIPQEVAAFKDSCELTRIALTVWVAKRAAFADFDRWMYASEPDRPWHARSIETAKTKAIELVGQAAFDAAKSDPWIERDVQTSVQIYGETGANAVPKLILGNRWVNPEPKDPADLVRILQGVFGLPQL